MIIYLKSEYKRIQIPEVKDQMLKVAGVVILYNPKKDIITNILSYLNQVDLLYVVDNSDNINDSLVEKIQLFKKTEYIFNNSNIGIAAALNRGANKAIDDNFDLLLTMDQDSQISDNFINEMLKEFEKNSKIGILTPFIVHNKNPKTPLNSGIENITVAMTSGSVLRLSAYQKIGGFIEKFFIDYVDNEYCLRMNSCGFNVLRLNSVYIYHELGDVKLRKFLYKNVFPTNHPPQRLYYRTRNRFYVHKTYKNKFLEYVIFDRLVFIKEILKIILYEKSKIEKFKMIFYGYRDFKNNKFGKFDISK